MTSQILIIPSECAPLSRFLKPVIPTWVKLRRNNHGLLRRNNHGLLRRNNHGLLRRNKHVYILRDAATEFENGEDMCFGGTCDSDTRYSEIHK